MSCWNEWDKLEEVIVGDCYSTVEGIVGKQKDALHQILEETKEDLSHLVSTLESLDVKVHRPEVKSFQEIQFPDFKINNHIPPMVPRDQFLVYGDTIYQTYTSMPNRYCDGLAYYKIFKDLYDRGYNWISMPPPSLQDLNSIDKTWWETRAPYWRLEDRILWHTATFFKCGDALITNSRGPGTPSGLEWMERNIPQKIYHSDKFGHIDHGFFMTDDETVFTCVNISDKLMDKRVINISRYVESTGELELHLKNLSLCESLSPEWIDYYFSEWRGYDQETAFVTNCLVVDSNNIIFGQECDALFKFLEGQGIKCHLSNQRHSLFWEGGIHCITLDLKRKGNCRNIL